MGTTQNTPFENVDYQDGGTTKQSSTSLAPHIFGTQNTLLENVHYQCRKSTKRRIRNLLFHIYYTKLCATQVILLENREQKGGGPTTAKDY